MLLELGRLRLRVSVLFAAFLALMLQNEARRALGPLFLAASLHETAHLVFLRAFGCRDLTLSLLPGGARLEGNAMAALSYRQACAAALAGPCCNFLLAGAAALFLFFGESSFARAFLRVNLTLGGVNLLPFSFLDGGGALLALLSQYKKGAPPTLRASDLALTAALAALSAGLLLFRVHAEFLFAFTGYCILYQIFRRQNPAG